MRKLHAAEERAPKPFVWRMAAAFAMAVCLVAVVQFAVIQQRREARTLALKAEQQQLVTDLQAMKQIVSDSEPVVVLENDHGTRVVLDIESAAQSPSPSHYD
jgi:hypothetical protein